MEPEQLSAVVQGNYVTQVRMPPKTSERICVLANPGSGLNSRDGAAIKKAMEALGPGATLREWDRGSSIDKAVEDALADGFGTIVAAGGDGTAVGVASVLLGKDVRFAVLPLGTFNYFARGIGLSEDPAVAAGAILSGTPHEISVGEVNGQPFLNNASVGIYPQILREREDTYARFGRSRIAAYWSVIKTFIRFQSPRRLTIAADGRTRTVRSPLLFIARSAYQLEQFGLIGAQAISDDRFAMFIAHGSSRAALFRLAWRLVRHKLVVGRDVDLIDAEEITVSTRHRRELVAFDGEKCSMTTPLKFRIHQDALRIILPEKVA